jgi:hypothetical protein
VAPVSVRGKGQVTPHVYQLRVSTSTTATLQANQSTAGYAEQSNSNIDKVQQQKKD